MRRRPSIVDDGYLGRQDDCPPHRNGCEAHVTGTPSIIGIPAARGRRAPGRYRATARDRNARHSRLRRSPPWTPACEQATADATKVGADISVAALDRNTGQLVTNGNGARASPSLRWSSCSSPTTCCCRCPEASHALARTTARCST